MEPPSKRSKKSMLKWVKGVALDPTKEPEDMQRWKRRVLEERSHFFARLDDSAKKELFASKKKHKADSEKGRGKKVASPDTLNIPRRMSKRIAQIAYQSIHYLNTYKKRVGLGPTFQADVPEWTGLPTEKDKEKYKADFDSLKWLGFQVWPAERDDRKESDIAIGKGRPENCDCPSPGSVTCISSHVAAARSQLKADLGQAFKDWGFDSMGEEVSKSWNDDEQKKFVKLENMKVKSEHKNFWKVCSEYFSFKSKIDIVRYYFNVFRPRVKRNRNASTESHKST